MSDGNKKTSDTILRMFGGKGSVDAKSEQDSESGPSQHDAGRFFMREAVEMVAPVFWATSATKLILVIRQFFFFGVGVLGFYQTLNWLIGGVPSSWWLVLQVPVVFLGLMATIAGIVK